MAQGSAQNESIFNEAIEKKWEEQRLFANTAHFGTAMSGDYGVFANGRWYLSKNIQEMAELLELKLKGKQRGKNTRKEE